jgi:uncharacterized protein RhaS with RHS repeats
LASCFQGFLFQEGHFVNGWPFARVHQVTNVGDDYDAAGNRTKITDPEGLITAYTYNERDLIQSVTDPEGLVTKYSYDPYG